MKIKRIFGCFAANSGFLFSNSPKMHAALQMSIAALCSSVASRVVGSPVGPSESEMYWKSYCRSWTGRASER